MAVSIDARYGLPSSTSLSTREVTDPIGAPVSRLTQEMIDALGRYPDSNLYLFAPQVPVLGPELIVNGDFSSGATGWLMEAGWTISGGVATSNTTANQDIWQATTLPIIGKSYVVTFRVISGSVKVHAGGSVTQYDAPNTYSVQLTATSTVLFRSTGIASSIDDISIKEIIGYSSSVPGLKPGIYSDISGTTFGQVDAQIGSVVDSRGNLGNELVSQTSWTLTQPTAGSVTNSSGTITVNSADGTYAAAISGNAAIGKSYRISGTVSGLSGNGVAVAIGASLFVPTSGQFSVVLTAPTISPFEIKRANGIGAGTISNISVREVNSIPATQATLANRPYLRRGLVNLLPYSTDLMNAGWSNPNIVKTAGTLTRANTASAYAGSPGLATNIPIGQKFTAAVRAKAKSIGNLIGVRPTGTYPDRSDGLFDISNGIVFGYGNGGSFTNTIASIYGPDAQGYYICAVSGVVGGTPLVSVIIGPSDNTKTASGWEGGSSVLSDCYLSDVGIFRGHFTAEQIATNGGIPYTAVAAGSSTIGLPSAMFDGVDDRVVLSKPNVQSSDDYVFVSACQLNDSAAANPTIFALAAAGNSNALVSFDFATGGQPRLARRDDAGLLEVITGANSFVNSPVVVSARKQGIAYRLRANSVEVASVDSGSVGATTLDSCAIGIRPTAAPTNPFSGIIYGLLVIKGTVTDKDLLTFEKWFAEYINMNDGSVPSLDLDFTQDYYGVWA